MDKPIPPSARYRTYSHARSVRLPAENYQTPHTSFFITVCTDKRAPYFATVEIGRLVLETWKEVVLNKGYRPWVICVMPDHLHAVIESGSEQFSSLGQLVSSAKSLTLHRVPKGYLRWQGKYYDHILRPNESPGAFARYVANNPVRAGLVEDWHEWPLTYIDPDITP